jgi:hypothetical protein
MPSRRRPLGGGGRRNPNSLANLRNAPAAPSGNRRALTHGGYATVARERLDAKVQEVFDALAADAPLRDADGSLPRADAALVRLLAECLCRLEDVSANVREFGLRDQKTKEVRPAVEVEMRLRREAADHLDALGMSPRSRARLGLDLARTVDAATAMSHPDPVERERLMSEAGLIEEDDT